MPVRPPPVEEFCHVMARKLGLLCKEWHNLSQNQVWASFLKVTQFELNEPKLSSHKQKTRMSIWLDQTLSSPVNLSMFFFSSILVFSRKGHSIPQIASEKLANFQILSTYFALSWQNHIPSTFCDDEWSREKSFRDVHYLGPGKGPGSSFEQSSTRNILQQ